MKKKKIAFVLEQALIGGIETSLINLLNKIDYEKYDITLFTNINNNPCIDAAPDKVAIVNLEEYEPKRLFYSAMQKKQFLKAGKIFYWYVRAKITRDETIRIKYNCVSTKLSDKIFDYAITYKQDYLSIARSVMQIDATRKLLWLHGDIWGETNTYLRWIESYDKIVCVSNDTKEKFLMKCPHLSAKTFVMHNIIDNDKIRRLAEKKLLLDDSYFHGTVITTVGRLIKEKGQLMIPPICEKLKNDGLDVTWLVIGDGDLREEMKRYIQECNVEKNVYLLGAKENPYPYMKHCDIYVNTTMYEPWGLTVQEAKILHKPIVATEMVSMREMINHMENGILVKPDVEQIYKAIKLLIMCPELQIKFENNLKLFEDKNGGDVQTFYEMLQES